MGCKAKDDSEPVSRVPVTAPAVPAPAPAEKPGSDSDLAVITVTAVDIDTKLAALCGISTSKVYFKYDSATVRPEAEEVLGKIASCARDGAAKGKELRVVGRADPRGSEQYNEELGLERAKAVAESLQAFGVAEPRIETVSKGEAAAEAADPSGWPDERRVTVRLGEG